MKRSVRWGGQWRIRNKWTTPLLGQSYNGNMYIRTYVYALTYTYLRIRTYVYVLTYTYLRIRTYVYVLTYTYLRIRTYVYVLTYTHLRIRIYVYVLTYTYLRIRTYVYVLTYTYLCIRTYVYVHIKTIGDRPGGNPVSIKNTMMDDCRHYRKITMLRFCGTLTE